MKIEELEAIVDNRGTLVEAFKHEGGQIHYIVINPNMTRGNHYHLRKNEEFIVVAGRATISVRNRDNGDVIHCEANASRPLKVSIFPNHTHRITADSDGAVVVSWNNEIFNPDDPDTYPEEI